ncbi:FMN-dependent NADH-azoreductase [Mycobacterium nebraskense]|uniref:FMN-dependent NADH-azoreductase n=1 Tax=Mycobacterium nebraskense TaxID=244292 RepID=UPI0023F5399C|nr:NAD(P)H-dependent oxidoreductase [Mycobacterium nebraskense]MBI2695728.1 NAD(P)H-dependent oxidoreductase [Mycobacterium nebraskense]
MTKLLFVVASPRKADSASIQLAETYLGALRASNPSLEVDVLDLWESDLPAFDGDKVAAKMNVIAGEGHNEVQRSAWDQIEGIAHRFMSADRYLIAAPMWNNGIPYRLKHYIDLIHQPGLLWGFDPQSGYTGLLAGKHATLALTSGVYALGACSPAFGVDHHSTYLRDWLNQAGVTAIDELRFQPSLLTEDPAGDLAKAKEGAVALARAHVCGRPGL